MNFSSMSTFLLFHWNSCHQALLLPTSKLMSFQNSFRCVLLLELVQRMICSKDEIILTYLVQVIESAVCNSPWWCFRNIYIVVTFLYMLTVPINLKMLWESFNLSMTKLKIGSIKTRNNRSHLEGDWKFVITTTTSTIS